MPPFWQTKKLEEMTYEEWESLCDGCGKCCLLKIEDADSGKVDYTNVACRLLDPDTCTCQDYANRSQIVPGCLVLSPKLVRELNWLPESCAYRRLAEGRGLAWWHPLITGDRESVHLAGISVRHRIITEGSIALSDLEDYITDSFD